MGKQIFGFLGVAGAGKDTSALILRQELEKKGLTIDEFAFATPLKTSLADLFDIKLSDFHERPTKDTKIVYGDKWTPRQLMCWFSKVCKSEFGDMFWVDKVERLILNSKADCVIVTDIRYPNEGAMLEKHGAVIAYVDRIKVLGPVAHDADPSEKAVHETLMSLETNPIYLNNNGTIDDLTDQIRRSMLSPASKQNHMANKKEPEEDGTRQTTVVGT